MQKEQIVGIAVRLSAIFLGLYTWRYVSGLVPLLAAPSQDSIGVGFLLLLALFPILASLLLWYFPLAVASKIIPDIKTEKASTPLDAGGIEVVAFSVMGLWVLTTAVPDIFYWIVFAYRTKSADFGNPELSPESVGYIVATVVELVIGFWLLFGSKGILGIIRRIRYAGM
jgi:hypothetical protein